MSYAMRRTSMSLDEMTLEVMEVLAKKLGTSKSAVVRKAVHELKRQADEDDKKPGPLEALDWLQKGGGLQEHEAEEFRSLVREERHARRYWWES